MYYTQRRATLPNPNGVDWVHGSAIALATSEDGFTWKYLGTCQGDHDLSEPLKAAGKGPEPGLTWWAPCLLYENKMFHMWVVLVDGVYRNWMGDRNIVHFTSEDGIAWKYADTCKLSSDRVIDPTVYKVKDLWYIPHSALRGCNFSGPIGQAASLIF
jgi:beta-xylosidase